MPHAAPRVVLIQPPSQCVVDDRLEPPLGMLYLAAAVRQSGCGEVEFFDMSGCATEEQIQAQLDRIPPAGLYGIGVLCTNHEYAKRVVARIRQVQPEAQVVLGGPNPSALPAETLADTGADAVVVGEGEDAFVECVARASTGKPVRGVLHRTPRQDIDSYPFPARDLVSELSYHRRLQGSPVLSVLSSRGCPHKCAYCNSVVMGGGATAARYRSPRNVCQEIAALRDTTRHFRFNDDCFSSRPDLPDLLAALSALEIVFRIFARVEDLTPDTCRALRQSGCAHVAVGLESLDPENLRILGRGPQIGHERNVQAARDAVLTVRAYFMVGLPHDSDASIERYFTTAAGLGVDEFTVYPLIPYPGTRIARNPERFGYAITNPDFRDYVQIGVNRSSCFALRHKNFGPDDVARWRLRAEQILLEAGARRSHDSLVAR